MSGASNFKQAEVRDRLVIALDYPDRESALRLVEQVSGMVGMFKIGLQLFTAEGPGIVREIIEAGERVFLDLKFHDIPNTAGGAALSAARLGVSIFNLHALGGGEMMRAAARAVSDRGDSSRPLLLGVTVLTSMDAASMSEAGIDSDVDSEVVRLAALARDSGLDGVVASPREIRLIRERVAPERFVILTPGIRPAWSEAGDQKRVATPSEALKEGADYIVIGRAVTASKEPRAAVSRILEEIHSV
ncbi:MAG TPA: orotidine-5'-phosphate decarboxylase [Blastocatellia bacterium]|jgi:orotidine-5'-phosphate decarboxylase|nr:orotidine-5'-phosphate decarboxylase [Blastocatellia bacterium]